MAFLLATGDVAKDNYHEDLLFLIHFIQKVNIQEFDILNNFNHCVLLQISYDLRTTTKRKNMKSIKYKGMETCTTCVGDSNEWILWEYPEAEAIVFREAKEFGNINTLVFDLMKDNEFFFFELNDKVRISYNDEHIKDRKHEKVTVSKSEEKIIFTTQNRTIEFRKHIS